MQFDDALPAARRLAAGGKGAEDHVVMAALAERVAQLSEQLDALTKECNLRQDGVLLLSETTEKNVRIMRNRLCQIDGIQDAQEAQIFELRKRLPVKTKKPKAGGDDTEE